MVPLARRNLLADPSRLLMSLCGVAFAVLLVLLVLSLYRGWSELGSVYTRLPGNTWITQRGSSDPFHSASTLPGHRAEALAQIRGVRSVIPVYARTVRMAHGPPFGILFMALAVPANAPVSPSTRPYVPGPGTVTLDSAYADDAGIAVGDRVTVLGSSLRVGAIVSEGPRMLEVGFMNAADAARVFAAGDRVNYYLVDARPGVVSRRELLSAVPGADVRTSAQLASGFRREVTDNFLPVVGVLVLLGLLVGGAVTAITTYTATLEHGRDFAILKAIGASSLYLYRIVVGQSLLIGTCGAVIGVAVAAAAAHVIVDWVPQFVTDMRLGDTLTVFALTVLISVASAFLPVRRIDRIDPAEVFRA